SGAAIDARQAEPTRQRGRGGRAACRGTGGPIRGARAHGGGKRRGDLPMVRLGQNFLADPNLLDAIVRDAQLEPTDVALEIGGGEGVLTERIAERVAHLHVIELDERLVEDLEELAERAGNVSVVRGDAMRLELAALDPAPTTVPSNLPYSIATPVLLRTIAELPAVATWTVMVQREIADRLRAAPGTPA